MRKVRSGNARLYLWMYFDGKLTKTNLQTNDVNRGFEEIYKIRHITTHHNTETYMDPSGMFSSINNIIFLY